ncbi:MAG: hypothetical protein J7M26_10295 [Armatimonadetes bacterium]|nr:hypothetical protein [Armatimonadota bacterium]
MSSLLAVFLCSSVCVASQPVAEQLPLRVVWRAEGPIRVPIEQSVARRSVQLPAVRVQSGERALLRFRARLTTKGYAGWNEYLALVVNGEKAGARTKDGHARLVNRPPLWLADYRGKRWFSIWHQRNNYPCLNVWFAPDYTHLSDRVLRGRGEGYWYVLDLTDLLRPDGPNTLEFVNAALVSYWGSAEKVKGIALEIAGAELGLVAEKKLARLRASRGEVRRPQPGAKVIGQGWEATLTESGGVQVKTGGELYSLETGFEVLKRELALTCQEKPRGWQVHVRSRGRERAQAFAKSDRLRLQRTVCAEGHRLLVEDRVRNKTDRLLGMKVSQLLIGPKSFEQVRLAGRQELALARPWLAQNCTVHARAERTAMGLLILDDAFRCNATALAQENWARLEYGHFGLAPGDSYTFSLALYPAQGAEPVLAESDAVPQPSVNYWAFLNQVRRDIRTNFQLQGPFEFVNSRDKKLLEEKSLKALVERKGIRIFALTPWFEYYNGAHTDRAQYRAWLTRARAAVKKVVPDAICLALLETNLVSVPVEWFKGTLPKDWGYGHYDANKPKGKYGIAPPPAACKLIDESPWGDSMLRDSQGRPLLDTWYILPPYGVVDLMCYPRTGNYRERHMLEQLHFVLDELGLDGVYIDQFSMSRGVHAYDYGRWDGHTVDLDPETGAVKSKYAYVAIASAQSRRGIVEAVLQRGKTVVTNGPAVTWELQSLPIFRFMETQGYNVEGTGVPDQPILATGQLGSPIGLGHQWHWSRDPRAGRYFMRTVIAHLRYGLTYYYYATQIPEGAGAYGPVKTMFPITPVQLGEGFIAGKERVLTCKSGTYRVRWKARPRVKYFNERGEERPGKARLEGGPGAWRVTVELADLREVAAILPSP